MARFAKELQMAYLIALMVMSFRAAYLMMLIASLTWTFKAAYLLVLMASLRTC
jgi:hypothetical protein